jgi:nucleoside-diphosphate-sugar epimerase
MKTYLVLGANGYLGSYVHEAINHSADPIALVAVGRHPPRLVLPSQSSWVPLDVTKASVDELVILIQASRADALINCVGQSSGSSEQLWNVNASFVDKLIQALRLSGPIPLIHLGSAAEYGIQPQGIAIKEDAPAHPVSSYGRSKLAATRKILYSAELGDISATVLRIFNPIGVRAPENSLVGRALGELRAAVEMKRPSIVLGPLNAYRDFLAASDVATAVLLATQLSCRSPLINVGRGTAMSCRTLVELMADAAGFAGEIIETGEGSARSDEVPWQQADTTLLRRELNWLPNTPIPQVVKDLWRLDTEDGVGYLASSITDRGSA